MENRTEWSQNSIDRNMHCDIERIPSINSKEPKNPIPLYAHSIFVYKIHRDLILDPRGFPSRNVRHL